MLSAGRGCDSDIRDADQTRLIGPMAGNSVFVLRELDTRTHAMELRFWRTNTDESESNIREEGATCSRSSHDE